MVRKRPCRVCGRWFQPHRRAGGRQHTCSDPDCQRERHRRACKSWHGRHLGYDQEARLRAKLRRPTAVGAVESQAVEIEPLRQLDWERARDAVGLQVAVIVEESAQVLVDWARDAVRSHRRAITGEFGREVSGAARDAIVCAQGPP